MGPIFCRPGEIEPKKVSATTLPRARKPEPDDACARCAEALYDACRPAGTAVLVRPKPSQLQ